MNETRIRQIIREELAKAQIVFSIEPIEEGEDEGLAYLVTRLSLSEEFDVATVSTGKRNER